MTLTLRAFLLNDRPLTQPLAAHFDAEGGSVGRADHNTLALPDPQRHISRQQAEISASGTGYLIRNVGSANPIFVRGQPLARGEMAPLHHRDHLRIGGYVLEVIDEDAPDSETRTVVPGGAAVSTLPPGKSRRAAALTGNGAASPRTSPPRVCAGLGDLSAPLSRSNPFADLLGDAAPPPVESCRPGAALSAAASAAAAAAVRAADVCRSPLSDPYFNPQPAAAGVSPSSAAWGPADAAPLRALLPEDFDPFAAPESAPPAAPSAGSGVFADLIPGVEPASIDQLFDLQPGQVDPLAHFMADTTPPGSAGRGPLPGAGALSTDPLALFGNTADMPLPVDNQPTPPDHVPELHAAFVPPPVRRPVPSVPPAPPVLQTAVSLPITPPIAAPITAPRAPWSGDPRDLWVAFCDGAGVTVDPPQGIDPELMRVVGSLLQAAVVGTLQLMAVRATAKRELRAQVTIIQARNNNPLKFSPDARSALEQMLKPPMRGFLAGPAAMTDAMHDLVGHTIGTMAGTRAALEGMLDRFTPQRLEAKLADKSMLDNLLPMNRKAKLWELYLHHFETIRNEAQDDFHTLFGQAFLAAYEEQLERLHQNESGNA